MKNIQNKLVTLLFIALVFPYFGTSQDSSMNELIYEVNVVYPSISVTKEELKQAQTLDDINKYYKPSWVKEYISVEVLASHKGKIKKAVSKSDTFSQAQKDIMDMADTGTDISVEIEYIPENTLKSNPARKMDFSFTINPKNAAKYIGGEQQLKQYLTEKAIDKVPTGSFDNYDLATIKFTIDETGQVIDAQIFEPVFDTSNNEKIAKILLEAICNMPSWKPAEYANGTKVKQEFALTVGNMESCLVNLLNIRRD